MDGKEEKPSAGLTMKQKLQAKKAAAAKAVSEEKVKVTEAALKAKAKPVTTTPSKKASKTAPKTATKTVPKTIGKKGDKGKEKERKAIARNQLYVLQAKRRFGIVSKPTAVKPPPTPKSPFYLQITSTPETTVKGGLPLVTLPPGTVLFRGVRIPNVQAKEDPRYFFRDYLGDPMPNQSVCMSSTHNVFFYPFPFVAFGAHEVGVTFHSMQAVVLVHPLTVVASISPGQWVRGDAFQLSKPTDPYSRCTTFPYGCREQTKEELERRSYDNCLNPSFAQRSGVRGWMAIAQLDALKSKKYDLKKDTPPMLAYLKELEARFPGRGMEAMAWLYKDKNNNYGFPEIAVYPYVNHQGDAPINRVLRNRDDAIRIIEQEAANDNLNYLPLAVFTQKETINMVKGLYELNRLPINADTFARPAKNSQPDVEGHMNAWLNDAMTKGITLPFYGNSKLSFDTRTGFYVLPSLLPMNLRVPVPDAAIAAASAAAAAEKKAVENIPYSYLMMPLDTAEKRQLAMTYLLIFRSFYPQKLNTMFGLEKKVGVRRAMIFERPPVLKTLFGELGLEMPKAWGSALARASEQFKAEKAAKSAAQEAVEDTAAAKIAAAMPLAIVTDEAAYANTSTQPSFQGQSDFAILQPVANGNGTAIFSIPLNSHQALMELSDDDTYAKALEDADLLKYVEENNKSNNEGQKINPSYTFDSIEDYEAAPAEIRRKIDYYFSFLPKEKRFLIETDKVALFSITAPELADAQTKIILDTYKELKFPTDEAIYITDATACVGGNTISFAKAGLEVRALELSPQRAIMLAHNVLTTGYQNNVSVYNGDYTQLYFTLETDIVFMDPPWGGRDYKNKESLDLFLGKTNVNDLVVKITGGTQEEPAPVIFAKLVAIKAPLNFNIAGLVLALANANQGANIVKVVKQDKMQLILIQSEWKPSKASTSPPFTLNTGFSAAPPPISAPTVYKTTNEVEGAYTPPFTLSEGGSKRRMFTRKARRSFYRHSTRKQSAKTLPDYLRAFSSVWERHAEVKA